MNTAAGGLQRLHQLHLELERVRDELAKGPKRIRAARQRVERREHEREELQARLKQLKISADEKSLQLKTNEAKIAELQAKLNAATSNKEFDAFKSQIDADTMANSVLEDEILAVYEKIDQLESHIAEVEQQRTTAQEEQQQTIREVEDVVPGLRTKADELEQSLAACEKQLPEKIRLAYRRLVSAHGADALSPVEHQTCTGCSVQIRANTQIELNMGKYVFCSSCGRLLYQAEAE